MTLEQKILILGKTFVVVS